MEQTLTHRTLEQDERFLDVANQISEMTDEYCYGPRGVSEVLARHDVEGLIRVANEPYASDGALAKMSVDSLKFMHLLVPRFKVLYPYDSTVHKDRHEHEASIIAEAAEAVEMAVQVVIAAKIFEKVTTEIDGPTGLSDTTCTNLARYNPGNQKIVIDMTHQLYAKNIDDHKAGKDNQIIRHNGEAFGHIGGDLKVDVADNNGQTKRISLDEYKILLLMNDRRDLKQQLIKHSDPALVASLRAVEDIPLHAYQQRFEEIVVPTQLGKSLTTVGNGLRSVSSHVVRAAIKTSQNLGPIDSKRVVSTAALLGVAGTFGLSAPGRAEAATESRVTATANYAPASTISSLGASEVDGGLVVGVNSTDQLTTAKRQLQTVIDGGVVLAEAAAMELPINPQPVRNILRTQSEAVQNAADNGNIAAGARALISETSSGYIEILTATPQHATIENVDTLLAKKSGVPNEIIGEVRNMLIISEAALSAPDVLNTISAEEWDVIKGGKDSVETQKAISRLIEKHTALLIQQKGEINADITPDQLAQLAVLLASSEYYATHNLVQPVKPKAAPAPANPTQPSAGSRSLDKLPDQENKNLNEKTEKALQAVIDRGGDWENRGLTVRFLMRNDWTLEQAAGAVGNLMQESGVDPNSEQQISDPARGMGIVQWSRNGRWRSLLAFAETNNLDPYKLDTQHQFILHELHGREGHAYKAIMAATTVHDATMAFSVYYERPGDPRDTKRVENAQMVFDAVMEETEKISQPTPTSTPTLPATQPAPVTPEISIAPTDNNGGLVVPSASNTQLPIESEWGAETTTPTVSSSNQPVAPAEPDSLAKKPDTAHPAEGSSAPEKCAPGSVSLGIRKVYSRGESSQSELCAIVGLPSSGEESTPGSAFYVTGAEGNAIILAKYSKDLVAMVAAAKADNIDLRALSSFRTNAHQIELCNDNAECAQGQYLFVAKPGTSEHQNAKAIDFVDTNMGTHTNCTGSHLVDGKCVAPDSPTWQWLNAKASIHNFLQYENESWHWSPTGK